MTFIIRFLIDYVPGCFLKVYSQYFWLNMTEKKPEILPFQYNFYNLILFVIL